MKRKLLLSVVVLAVAFWVVPAMATITQTFSTPPGSNAGGGPVDVTAIFTLDSTASLFGGANVEISVFNSQTGIVDVQQVLTDLGFAFNTGQTTGTLINGGDAIARTINADKTFSDADSTTWGNWVLNQNVNLGVGGLGLKANDLGQGQPVNGIIGPGPYDAANGSIAGNGPHNPFFFGTAADPVDFFLTVNGLTAASEVNFVQFSFGTTPGNNVNVPIPPSALLLGSGLLGIVGFGWRRRKG